MDKRFQKHYFCTYSNYDRKNYVCTNYLKIFLLQSIIRLQRFRNKFSPLTTNTPLLPFHAVVDLRDGSSSLLERFFLYFCIKFNS